MKPIPSLAGLSAGIALTACLFWMPPFVSAQDALTGAAALAAADELRPVSAFDSIADERERSIAIFEETGKVLLHPRCVNCHPAGDRPLQDITMALHQPPVFRGPANFGEVGMQCNTCHGEENVELLAQADGVESIPGHPNWHLAPIEMAWEGRSLGEICRQIKDTNRNGGKTLAELVEHMAEDTLVGWGWNPGAGREPVPSTQEEFGALYKAWAATGAHCPAE